jgi:GntR family transcriptional regulator
VETDTKIVTGSVPKYRQLLMILRHQILTGVYAPGARLPSEDELSNTYDLSRGTVRKAMAQLEAERLVRTEQGIGSFVQTSHPNAIPFHFVDPLPAESAEAGRARFETVAQKEVTAPLDIAEALRLPLGTTVLHIARRRWLGDTACSFSERYLSSDLIPSLLHEDLSTHPFLHYLLVSRAELPLMRTEISIEAHLVSEEEARLLRVEPGTSVIVVQRMTFTAPNRPAVWYRGLFHKEYHLAVQAGDSTPCSAT